MPAIETPTSATMSTKSSESIALGTACLDDIKAQAQQRLSGSRYAHSVSVAEQASFLAHKYDFDVDKAYVAGILHDWDKNLDDETLLELAQTYELSLPAGLLEMPALLHAFTGAETVRRTFAVVPADVLQAISRHTTGAVDMSELDMIVYIADMIDPLREEPELDKLKALAGTISLEELFLKSYEASLLRVVERHKLIHPASLTVWNAYVIKERLDKNKPIDYHLK